MSRTKQSSFDKIPLLALSRTTALGEDFLVEIGRIVANFALLETELFALINGLLGGNRIKSRIVTSELSFGNLLMSLSASLVKAVHGDEDFRRYKNVLTIVSMAEAIRNQIIHSVWGMDFSAPRSAMRNKRTAKRSAGLIEQHEKYLIEDLIQSVQKISLAIYSLEKFRESLGYGWSG